MEELKREICRLINRLDESISAEQNIEAMVLSFLKRFFQEVGQPGKKGSADIVFAELRRFWLDAVPWCSELSKDIEKIIMMYEDLEGDAGQLSNSA